MVNKHMKKCSTSLLFKKKKKTNSNYNEVPLHIHENGYKLKSVTTPKAGETLEQIEISYTSTIKCHNEFWKKVSYKKKKTH